MDVHPLSRVAGELESYAAHSDANRFSSGPLHQDFFFITETLLDSVNKAAARSLDASCLQVPALRLANVAKSIRRLSDSERDRLFIRRPVPLGCDYAIQSVVTDMRRASLTDNRWLAPDRTRAVVACIPLFAQDLA